MTDIADILSRFRVCVDAHRPADMIGGWFLPGDLSAILAHIDAQAARIAEAEQSEAELKMACDDLDLKVEAQAARIAELELECDEARGAAHARAIAVDMGDAEADAQQARIAALEDALADGLATRGIPRRDEYLSEFGLQGAIDADKRARALLTPEKSDAP